MGAWQCYRWPELESLDALLPAQPVQGPSPLIFGLTKTPRVAQALSRLGVKQVS